MLRCFQRAILFVLFFFFFSQKTEKRSNEINQLKAAIFTHLRGSKDSDIDFEISS